MADAAVTVIGGGVVGLAVAAELAPGHAPLLCLERNPRYGQETSSRNSEVIHAGLYYPTGSLKATLCVEGNHLLYELCDRNGIPHRRITKVVIAALSREIPELERLHSLGTANGAPLRMVGREEMAELEPDVPAVAGLFSPSTGIISAHGLMDYFAHALRSAGGYLQERCEVVGIERGGDGYRVSIREGGSVSTFTTERIVNAAGLESDSVAAMAGIDVDAAGYRLHWCRGSYFALPGTYSRLMHRLIYPVPSPDSLGVHALLDLGGRLKFGPDVEYLATRSADYTVDPAKRHAFAESVRRILPSVRDDELTPDMSGIRPKLQAQGGPFRDYIIADEGGRGLPGFINLIGIESPGLTASPAIARYVRSLLDA